MQAQTPHPWTLRFSFFGIPVSIQPMAWVVLALLGGAFGVSTSEDLTQTLVFMAAGMLCLLVHEFGHAVQSMLPRWFQCVTTVPR